MHHFIGHLFITSLCILSEHFHNNLGTVPSVLPWMFPLSSSLSLHCYTLLDPVVVVVSVLPWMFPLSSSLSLHCYTLLDPVVVVSVLPQMFPLSSSLSLHCYTLIQPVVIVSVLPWMFRLSSSLCLHCYTLLDPVIVSVFLGCSLCLVPFVSIVIRCLTQSSSSRFFLG